MMVVMMMTTYEDFLNDLTHHLKSCLNAITFVPTSIPVYHKWEFTLLSVKHWNAFIYHIKRWCWK